MQLQGDAERPSGGQRGERGQAAPLGLALATLAVVLTLAIADVARDAIDASRARTAADAAALASVVGGRSAAERLAGAHGATVTVWRRVGEDVEVTVRVGDAVAIARASGGPAGFRGEVLPTLDHRESHQARRRHGRLATGPNS